MVNGLREPRWLRWPARADELLDACPKFIDNSHAGLCRMETFLVIVRQGRKTLQGVTADVGKRLLEYLVVPEGLSQ